LPEGDLVIGAPPVGAEAVEVVGIVGGGAAVVEIVAGTVVAGVAVVAVGATVEVVT
jgi:hypothetical protein